MEILTLLIFIIMVFLLTCSYFDIKTSEIPDKASIGMVIVILIVSIVYSILKKSPGVLVEPLSVGAAYFILGYALFKLGQWGGGDVKVMAGIGCSLGLLGALNYQWNNRLFHYSLSYLINMAFVALPYVITYALLMGIRNPKVVDEFKKTMKKKHILFVFFVSFAPLLFAIYLDLQSLSVIYALIPPLFLSSVYLKTVEHVGMRKNIRVRELKEGDVVAGDIIVKEKKVASKRNMEGLTREQVEKIQALAKSGEIPEEITIKWGVRFVPILFVTFLVTLYGNLMEIVFDYVII